MQSTYVIYYRKSKNGREYRTEQKAASERDARYNFRQKHLHWSITGSELKPRHVSKRS